MSWYDTEKEAADLRLLESRFTEVINPNAHSFRSAVKTAKANGQNSMKPFLQAVESCDGVAWRAFKNGKVGAGVAAEVFHALMLGKPVYRLPDLAKCAFHLDDVASMAYTQQLLKQPI